MDEILNVTITTIFDLPEVIIDGPIYDYKNNDIIGVAEIYYKDKIEEYYVTHANWKIFGVKHKKQEKDIKPKAKINRTYINMDEAILENLVLTLRNKYYKITYQLIDKDN